MMIATPKLLTRIDPFGATYDDAFASVKHDTIASLALTNVPDTTRTTIANLSVRFRAQISAAIPIHKHVVQTTPA